LTTHTGKAQAAVKIMDRTVVKDSLLLCDSAWPLMVSWNTPDRVGDPKLESRIFTAVTGIETGEAGLSRYGERIFNLQRGILLREGRRPKKDDYPGEFNFTDPVQSVFMNPEVIIPGPGEEMISRKGGILDRGAFEAMRKEFYELRGWDAETGLQKAETLERIGLFELK
jgi:aldehyde:ferredoxin oxidoreductase